MAGRQNGDAMKMNDREAVALGSANAVARESVVCRKSVDYPIHGYCRAGFEAVRDAFETNFQTEDEVGACVSVVVDGQTVVDLWGG